MTKLPTTQEIQALHLKYAPTAEAFELVFTHCRIVWEVAQQLLELSNSDGVDHELVRVGCLLHDIGVYRLYGSDGRIDHGAYIKHGILGHEILQAEGFDESICRFCSCHTGVGLTAEDVRVQQLQLPIADYIAGTAEERLVMYADKFHTKSAPPKFMTTMAYIQNVSRFGEDKVSKFKMLIEEFGEPDLMALAAHRSAYMHGYLKARIDRGG